MPTNSSGARRKPKQVKVYVEAGVTMAVTEDPPQYVKFLFGQERLALSDSPTDIKKAEAQAYELCEAVVEKRVRKLAKLIKQVQATS